tara:strand:- start:1388 stop:1600 length:213 start_codon:yes stop_codon:yes gene_type:complete
MNYVILIETKEKLTFTFFDDQCTNLTKFVDYVLTSEGGQKTSDILKITITELDLAIKELDKNYLISKETK